jgi:hypothetical protein
MNVDLGVPKNRLLLALAISIAIHETAAGLVPRAQWSPSPAREVVTRAQIVRIAVRPAPTATPPPVRAIAPRTLAAARTRELPAAARQVGSSSVRRTEPRRVATIAPGRDRPVWDVASTGTARSIVVAAGSGADGNSGAGAAGNAAAPAADNRPCGFVTFSDPHGSQYDPRTHGFWVDIRMSVRFADGTTQSMILDYPWYYASEAANPWSYQNVRDPNFPTRFQPPPP